ncbi:uncharacterized protein HaLaN_14718 [Haematococcus lacustris]|uniref:Uncharacterized protein n=1 Tax=Haematococcus lacustris TaxID=44745 RepID=A0A699ZFX5_HAELA|nr:uncharacterized protein HaLaN_14718 [Haematococcus lacustris]
MPDPDCSSHCLCLQVYVSPYQWSFPLNLPPQFFGIFPAGELQSDDPDTPWADEIEQKVFLPPSIGQCRRQGQQGLVA